MSQKQSLTLDINRKDEIIAAIVAATQNLFLTTFKLEVKAEPAHVTNSYAGKADISGSIGMIQEKIEATMTIGFPKNLIIEIMSKAYKRDFEKIENSVKDGVGEIINVIYALTRKNLNGKGFDFRMSVPHVVLGTNHEVHHLHHGQTIVIPFLAGSDRFTVFVTLQNSPPING